MENPVINEDVIRKYLLGELPDSEREQIEMCLLVNDEFFHNLTTLEEMVEDELIDQYVSGELAGGERKKFEQRLLSSPECREKLYLARDLNEYESATVVDSQVNVPTHGFPTRWRALFAFRNLSSPLVGVLCVLLIAIVSVAWLFFRTRQLEAELGRLLTGQQSFPPEVRELTEQLNQLRARNEELAAKLRDSEAGRAHAEQEAASLASAGRQSRGTSDSNGRTASNNAASSRTGPSVIPLVLSMVSRSPENEPVKVLNLSPKVSRVQLYLNLEDIDSTDYDGFQIELKKRRDETLVRRISARSRARQKQLVVQLPSKLLAEGEYVIELNGLFNRGQSEPVGTYSFRVAPQK